MISKRKTAIITGVLYIIGTAAGIASLALMSPVIEDPQYLAKIASHENQVLIGCLFALTMGLALALVPVFLYPLLSKINQALALGYLVFRGALETVTYILGVTSLFFLVVLSRLSTLNTAPQAGFFQDLGALLQEGYAAINNITIIVFCLGALMLYVGLYRSKLVPRWISIWGIAAILLHLPTAFLAMFRLLEPFTPLNLALNFPIFLQEMVMAGWLIVKGFDAVALRMPPVAA